MKNLKIMIKNELEKDKTLATKLAVIGGFKNATSLYKFLNDPDREMDNLLCLTSMIEYLFGDDEILNVYFRTINPNRKLARQAMEYSSYNLMEVRKELIKKLEESDNVESKEWATMYELIQNTYKNPLEKLKKVNLTNVKSQEMKAFKSIIQLFCYYYLNNLEMVEIISENLLKEIDNIKNNDFVKQNFKLRYFKTKAMLYLQRNRLEESRYCLDKVIKMTNNCYILATAFQMKGMSYLFEDFEEGNAILLKAHANYIKYPKRFDGEIRSSLNLHRAYWNKPMFDLRPDGEVFDKHDAILHYVRNNQIEMAERLLVSIDENKLNDKDLAFQYYSKGIIYNKNHYFYESIKLFKKVGNRFYINLPVSELRNKGSDSDLLKLILL